MHPNIFQVPAINLPVDSPSPPTPPCESPCQPPKYNEDEPEIADDEERLTPIDDKVTMPDQQNFIFVHITFASKAG